MRYIPTFPLLLFLFIQLSACDKYEQADVGYSLDINYFLGNSSPNPNINNILQSSCASLSCHAINSQTGGRFHLYTISDTSAKQISNFISAQSMASTSNPASSILLQKPLAVSAGGVSHQGGATYFSAVINAGDIGYSDIYLWINTPVP